MLYIKISDRSNTLCILHREFFKYHSIQAASHVPILSRTRASGYKNRVLGTTCFPWLRGNLPWPEACNIWHQAK